MLGSDAGVMSDDSAAQKLLGEIPNVFEISQSGIIRCFAWVH